MSSNNVLASDTDDLVVKEILLQYEALVYVLCQCSSAAQLSTEQSEKLRAIEKLREQGDIKNQLRVVNDSVIRLCKNPRNTVAILDRLTGIVDSLSPLKDPKKKKQKPTSEDEQNDTTLDCFVIKTMRKSVNAYVEANLNRQIAEGIENPPKIHVSPPTVQYCYDRIQQEAYPAIRYQATLLLGAISSVQLSEIHRFFLDKFNALKKDSEIKSFIYFQKAIAELDYCVADDERTAATFEYLQLIADKVPNMKKASLLYPDLMQTVRNIFARILDAEDPERVRQFAKFSKLGSNTTKFWDLFKSIYSFLHKLNQKSKHRPYVMNTQQCMLARATEEFYFSKTPSPVEELFKTFTAGLKEKKERYDTFCYIKSFVKDVRADLVKKDLDRFSNFMKQVVGTMFNRKEKFSPEECVTAEQFLIEYSKKYLQNVVRIIEEVLEYNKQMEQKSVALRALSQIAQFAYDEVSNYNYLLGPILTKLFLDEKNRQEIVLLRALLLCFPKVKNPNEEIMKQIRQVTGTLLLFHDKEVRQNAAACLESSIAMEPRKTLLDVFSIYANVATMVESMSSEDALFLFSSLCRVCQTFIAEQSKEGKITIDAQVFLNLRKRLEGVSLLWLCSTNCQTKQQVWTTLQWLTHETFRSITKDKVAHESPYLLDGLLTLDSVSHPFDSAWFTPLTATLQLHADTNDSIKYAFGELVKRYSYLLPSQQMQDFQQQELQGDALQLFANYVKFNCLAARPTSGEFLISFLNEMLHELRQPNRSIEYHTMIIQSLECLDLTTIEYLTSALRKLIPQRALRGDKKMKRLESNDPVFEKNVLELMNRIIKRLDIDYIFSNGAPIRDFYEELIRNWSGLKEQLTAKELVGSILTIETWRTAVDMIQHYLSLILQKSAQKSVETSEELSQSCMHYSPLLKEFGFEKVRLALYNFCVKSELATIDAVAIQAICQLFRFAPVNDAIWISQIVHYFHYALALNSVIVDPMIELMTIFLQQNGNLFPAFLDNTFVENFAKASQIIEQGITPLMEEKKPSAMKLKTKKESLPTAAEDSPSQDVKPYTPLICSCYIKSITNALPLLWNQSNPSIVNPGQLLLVCMVHMCSEWQLIRHAAYLQSITLCQQLNSNKLKMGYTVTAPQDATSYVYYAKQFSQQCALQFVPLTSSLMQEALRILSILQEQHCYHLMQLVVPWMSNYGHLVRQSLLFWNQHGNQEYQFSNSLPRQMITMVYQWSQKYFTVESWQPILEQQWIHLAQSCQIIPLVIDDLLEFLLQEYKQQEAQQQLIRSVVVYMARCDMAHDLICQKLIRYLRHYTPISSINVETVLLEKTLEKQVPVSLVSQKEKSAFELLINLAQDSSKHIQLLHQFLPILFCNSVILYQSCANQSVSAMQWLQFSLQTIALRNTTSASSIQMDSIVSLIQQLESLPTNTKLSRQPALLQQMVSVYSANQYEQVCMNIIREALEWAIQSKDQQISLESIHVIDALTLDNHLFSKDIIYKLIAICLESICTKQEQKITSVIQLLSKPSFANEPMIYSLMNWCLFSWNTQHVNMSMQWICQQMQKQQHLQSFVMAWQMDVPSLCKVLTKGFLDLDNDTLWKQTNQVLQNFITLLPTDCSILCILQLLISTCCVTSGREDYGQLMLTSMKQNSVLVPFANRLEQFKENSNLVSLIGDMTSMYQQVFANKNGNVVLQCLIRLMKSGPLQWAPTLLLLLSHLLPVIFEKEWTVKDLASLGRMVRQGMIPQDETETLFTTCCADVMEFLLQLIRPNNDSDRSEIFDSLQQPLIGYKNFLTRVREISQQQQPNWFLTFDVIDREELREEMIKRIARQWFGIPLESEVMKRVILYGMMESSQVLDPQAPKEVAFYIPSSTNELNQVGEGQQVVVPPQTPNSPILFSPAPVSSPDPMKMASYVTPSAPTASNNSPPPPPPAAPGTPSVNEDAQRLDIERQEKQRFEEQQRLEREKQQREERERQEKLERERQERERQERDRLQREEKERLEKQNQIEREKQEKERLEKERQDREREEKERKAKEQAERLIREKLERERQEKERLENEAKEQARLEKERLEKERLEQERLEQERQQATAASTVTFDAPPPPPPPPMPASRSGAAPISKATAKFLQEANKPKASLEDELKNFRLKRPSQAPNSENKEDFIQKLAQKAKTVDNK